MRAIKAISVLVLGILIGITLAWFFLPGRYQRIDTLARFDTFSGNTEVFDASTEKWVSLTALRAANSRALPETLGGVPVTWTK